MSKVWDYPFNAKSADSFNNQKTNMSTDILLNKQLNNNLWKAEPDSEAPVKFGQTNSQH